MRKKQSGAGGQPFALHKKKGDNTRINDRIIADTVRLIDKDGENLGPVPLSKALELAKEASLDLVEIVPNADPPVARIMDYGKHRYHIQKKETQARKNQKIIETKEVKFRPVIQEHDYQIKLKAIHKFCHDGAKVRVTMRFRGREISHAEVGMEILKRIREDIQEYARVEEGPRIEGRLGFMLVVPKVASAGV